MQTLKFLGRGGAFFPEEGNTAAYFIQDNTMYLFDCGETVFTTLIKDNKLLNLIKDNSVNNIEIYITHMHSDHVGSLSSLIYYCHFVLGINPKIYCQSVIVIGEEIKNSLKLFLRMQGHSDEEYQILRRPSKGIEAIPCYHVDTISSWHYCITTKEGKKIFYSGDCCKLLDVVCQRLKDADEIYLECSTRESGVHLTLDMINGYMKEHDIKLNDRVYLMHIDTLELIDKAKEYNMKVVELDK